MFSFLNILAFKITRENWGFPWHIILANILTQIALCVFMLKVDILHAIAFSWVTVNAIGLLNEMYQKLKRRNPKKDFWQDMFANNLGWLSALLFVLLK